MRGRGTRIAVATAVLVGINLLGRLAVRLYLPEGRDPLLAGLWAVLVIVLAAAVVAFVWTRQRRVALAAADLVAVVAVTAVLVTVVGPFVSGGLDAGLPLWRTLLQLLLALALLSVGAAAGLLTAVALGLDPTSRAWRRMAQQPARPGRPAARGGAGAGAGKGAAGKGAPGKAAAGKGAPGRTAAGKAAAGRAAGSTQPGRAAPGTGAGAGQGGTAPDPTPGRARGRTARRASASVPVASGSTRVEVDDLPGTEVVPDGTPEDEAGQPGGGTR